MTPQPPEPAAEAPYLSIVATSRNDNHGGDLLHRMQIFVDALIAQAKRFNLACELILVEWNPPADRPPLEDALVWPGDTGPCEVRIVTVPAHLHRRLECSESLPLFQMIAKNVGIRRARGQFVLATNIDVLFSDALLAYIADRKLDPACLYRIDRYDVRPDVPMSAPVTEQLQFCENNVIRINRRLGTEDGTTGELARIYKAWPPILGKAAGRLAWHGCQSVPLARWLAVPAVAGVAYVRWAYFSYLTNITGDDVRAFATRRNPPYSVRIRRFLAHRARQGRRAAAMALALRLGPRTIRFVRRHRERRLAALLALEFRFAPRRARREIRRTVAALRREWAKPRLHTNACGDFTLMSREAWANLRGYPEWEIFSWHLDSVLVHQARGNGLRIWELTEPMRIYHVEHALGSGWTPEGQELLMARLKAARIRFLTDSDFSRIAREIAANTKIGRPTVFNCEDWGLRHEQLASSVVGAVKSVRTQSISGPPSVGQDEFGVELGRRAT